MSSSFQKQFKEVVVQTTFTYWILNISLYVLYQLIALYVMYKLRDHMIRRNYFVIFIFSLVLLIRVVHNTLLYFWISEKGTSDVSEEDQDMLNKRLETTYIFIFVNSLLEYLLILIFYNIIFNMINVWDQLYYENVASQAEMTQRQTKELTELMHHINLAKDKIKRNSKFKNCFLIWFSGLNFCLFGAQVMFISMFQNEMEETKYVIAAIGTILVVMNMYMAYKFVRTLKRFISLLDNGSDMKCFNQFRFLLLYLSAILFVLRAISANIFRAGSKILQLLSGGELFLHYLVRQPNSWKVILIKILIFCQDIFPVLIGLAILWIYHWFGRSQINSPGMETDLSDEEDLTIQGYSPNYSSNDVKTISERPFSTNRGVVSIDVQSLKRSLNIGNQSRVGGNKSPMRMNFGLNLNESSQYQSS